MKHAMIIASVAVRELLFERVFYLLISFGAVSLGISLMLGQMTYIEQSKLTLDFLLAAIQLSMILFSVFMGISLFHRELVQNSISMVLSKPISRTSFIIGKFLGQLIVQGLVIAAMALILFVVTLRFDEAVSYVSIFQSVLLIFFETAVVTAITYLFAVNAGAITAAIGTLFMFGLGHLCDTVGKSLSRFENRLVWKIVKPAIPDLEVFNMKTLASYGHSISGTEMLWASVYAASCVALYISLASICFSRKDILT